MKKQYCKRPEIKECPYREVDGDTLIHWLRTGSSIKKAEERAGSLCVSIPCLFAIELSLNK